MMMHGLVKVKFDLYFILDSFCPSYFETVFFVLYTSSAIMLVPN